MITVLAGGVGAAKFLNGLQRVVDPVTVTAIVNVGDDFELHGLSISPDLDTVTYTVAGAVNPETGWGLRGETWAAMGALERYRGVTWFQLGDQDLATHLYRTQRRSEGATLSTVTAEIITAWGIGFAVLPVTDDPLRTKVTLAENGDEVDFQTYFVREHHDIGVRSVRFQGADAARPGPGVIEAIERATTIVIAPSNPIVSIAPVLAVPGVRAAVEARRAHTVGISPIIGGQALKGPADRMLRELGHEVSVVGVARLYRSLCATLVIDTVDAGLAGAVEAEGVRAVVCPTIMSDAAAAAAVAAATLAAAARA